MNASLELNRSLRVVAQAAFAGDYVLSDGAKSEGNCIVSMRTAKLNGKLFLRTSKARMFTGRYYSSSEDAGDRRLVFVTEHGEVYHSDKTCSHIKLKIREVSAVDAEKDRNYKGGKYHPCEYCIKGSVPERVFITEFGDRFHSDSYCTGIKRTVMSMTVKEAVEKGKRPCSKCGQ